jgi:hypothetical protein
LGLENSKFNGKDKVSKKDENIIIFILAASILFPRITRIFSEVWEVFYDEQEMGISFHLIFISMFGRLQ